MDDDEKCESCNKKEKSHLMRTELEELMEAIEKERHYSFSSIKELKGMIEYE